jgi:hypothetical protein
MSTLRLTRLLPLASAKLVCWRITPESSTAMPMPVPSRPGVGVDRDVAACLDRARRGAGRAFQGACAALHGAIGRHGLDVGALGQLVQLVDRDLHREATHERVARVHRPAELQHRGAQVAQLLVGAVAGDDDLELLAAAHLALPGALVLAVSVARRVGAAAVVQMLGKVPCELGAGLAGMGTVALMAVARGADLSRPQQGQQGNRQHRGDVGQCLSNVRHRFSLVRGTTP